MAEKRTLHYIERRRADGNRPGVAAALASRHGLVRRVMWPNRLKYRSA